MTKQSQVKLLLACLLLSNLIAVRIVHQALAKIDSKNMTEEDNYVKFIILVCSLY